MKKFISTIQNLSERAAQLQAAAQSAPPKIAQLREAVALTSGQLQQLKSDVEVGLAELKADNEGHLLDSLLEINSSVFVFQQAGYDLGGVDMELSPINRLVVHLNRVHDVPLSTLRSLLASNQHRKVTRALLKSLIQAEETADQVDLTNLVYYKLVVNVGPIPSVRLCWRTEDAALLTEIEPLRPTAAAATADVSTASTPATSFPMYGKGSFFASPSQPASQPVEAVAELLMPAPGASAAAPVPAAETPSNVAFQSPAIAAARAGYRHYRTGGKDWGAASLEQFKKMPGVSKYRR